jgi:hypothetical protein
VYNLNSTSRTITAPFSVTKIPVPGQYYFVANGYGASEILLQLTIEHKVESPLPKILGPVGTLVFVLLAIIAARREQH